MLPDSIELQERAGLLLTLCDKVKGIKMMEKVEKLYLQNPNLAYALSESLPDIGSVRETIFLAWTKPYLSGTASPVADFEINGRTFEIGGKNKGRKQLQEAAEGYVIKDDIEYAFKGTFSLSQKTQGSLLTWAWRENALLRTIPLWHFGFLY